MRRVLLLNYSLSFIISQDLKKAKIISKIVEKSLRQLLATWLVVSKGFTAYNKGQYIDKC
jgi:hypothetical protein